VDLKITVRYIYQFNPFSDAIQEAQKKINITLEQEVAVDRKKIPFLKSDGVF